MNDDEEVIVYARLCVGVINRVFVSVQEISFVCVLQVLESVVDIDWSFESEWERELEGVMERYEWEWVKEFSFVGVP